MLKIFKNLKKLVINFDINKVQYMELLREIGES